MSRLLTAILTILLAVLIFFSCHYESLFDRECREKGGQPVHVRDISLCLEHGVLI